MTKRICSASLGQRIPIATTNAERSFETRGNDTEHRDTYEHVRSFIDEVDRIVGAIEEKRLALGLTKAELARRVGVAREPGQLLCLAGLFDDHELYAQELQKAFESTLN